MKYRRLDSFDAAFKKLKGEHQVAFKSVVRQKFAPACDAWAAAHDALTAYVWPKSPRVDEMRWDDCIPEMTWSLASPDGRATFQLASEDGQWISVWRRIGDHGRYDIP